MNPQPRPDAAESANAFEDRPFERQVDLNLILRTVKAHRWTILTVTVIACLLSVVYALRLPDVYSASSKIMISRPQKTATKYEEVTVPDAVQAQTYLKTQMEILRSRTLLRRVVDELGLQSYYGVPSPEEAVDRLLQKTSVALMHDTQVLLLTVRDFKPDMAARITESVAQNFVKEVWRSKLFVSEQLLEWFPDDAGALQASQPIDRLKQLDRDEFVLSLPSVVQDPIIAGMRQEASQVETTLSEALNRYTEKHPVVKELRARREQLDRQIRAQIDQTVAGLKASLSGGFSTEDAKVIESATAPRRPSGPNRIQMVLFGTALGFFGSTVVCLLLFFIARNVRTEEDLRSLGLPLLGHIAQYPFLKEEGVANFAATIKTTPRLNDEIMSFRTALLFSLPANRNRVITVTSCLPGEGKSTISVLLATAMAVAGQKTLLIDADLRRPTSHRILKMDNRIGLSNCLSGQASMAEAVRTVPALPSLSVMTSGPISLNSSVVLGSPAMNALLAEALTQYEKVILDSPPILHIPDGLILSSKSEGVVLAVREGFPHFQLVKEAMRKIGRSGGQLIGAVLNCATPEMLEHSYYGSYQRYDKYYSSGERHSPSTSA